MYSFTILYTNCIYMYAGYILKKKWNENVYFNSKSCCCHCCYISHEKIIEIKYRRQWYGYKSYNWIWIKYWRSKSKNKLNNISVKDKQMTWVLKRRAKNKKKTEARHTIHNLRKRIEIKMPTYNTKIYIS